MIEHFRPRFCCFAPIAPFVFFAHLPIKIALKGAIPPTLRTTGLESDSVRNDINPNNKKPEITNKNIWKITCQHGQPRWVSKVLRSLCRDFHLHFQVLWLTPLLRCCLKALVNKKRFSREVLANTARFLRFTSLQTLRILALEGIANFGIALAKRCNLVFCSFVLQIDWWKPFLMEHT